MIEIGKRQALVIKRFKSQGAYLNTEKENEGDILLPKLEVPRDAEIGDKIDVFVYNDSDDRLIATTRRSKGQVGEIVRLKVVSTTKFGAFLDWGLEKDVFLPLKETIGGVTVGEEHLVALYLDRSDRVCASMKLQDYLEKGTSLNQGQIVRGTIYSLNKSIGAFIAIENKYNGLIQEEELLGAYQLGDEIEARVRRVRPDGKVDLTLKGKAHLGMAEDLNVILDRLKKNNGYLPFNDKSSPADIKKEFNMSKASFKRALGNLYRERMIDFQDSGIKLL